MTTDINMSLDDIIKKNRSAKGFNASKKKPTLRRNNQNPRSGPGNQSGGGGGFNGPRFRNNSRTRSTARFSPYKRGDIDRPWSHDLYEDNYIAKQRIGSSEGTKIIISNLEFGVTDSDLEELFMEVGPLISSEIHYDKSGRSIGSGSVVFEERTDAIRAINQYNGIPLDGRPMEIEIASPAPNRLVENRRVGNFRNNRRMGGGNNAVGGRRRFNPSGNRGGGKMMGNRRRNTANISAEQLDAELDEYRAKAV